MRARTGRTDAQLNTIFPSYAQQPDLGLVRAARESGDCVALLQADVLAACAQVGGVALHNEAGASPTPASLWK